MTGAEWLDPILGLAIGILVLWSSIGILRESSHILLEGRPREMHVEEVARAILTIEGVQEFTTCTSGRWAEDTMRSVCMREFRICTWMSASAS